MIGPGRLVNNRLRASFSLVLKSVHAGGKLQQRDALVACGPIGLGRYAQQDRVRVKPGETYRQPQAASFKLDNRSGIV